MLVLRRPLDREDVKKLEFTVVARDLGSPALETSARVVLSVADRNDNSPVFGRDSYSFSVDENAPAPALLGSVSASDDDEGSNGRVTFALRSSHGGGVDEDGLFSIDAASGQISTTRRLDREESERYELVVEAVDGGRPPRSSQALVSVAVNDVNDNAPEIAEPAGKAVYVRRNSLPGTIIGKLVLMDRDEDGSKSSASVQG